MSKEKTKQYSILDENIPEGKTLGFRMTPEGEITKGHWVNKGKLKPTGEGYKFTLKSKRGFTVRKPTGELSFQEDSRGELGYLLKNLDYGWEKVTPITDESGVVYDNVVKNAQGHDFDSMHFKSIDSALSAAKDWLEERESRRGV